MPNILMVDDELNILDLVRLYLEREGYRVETATTAKEFSLLNAFVQNPGIVLSREKLLEVVWGFKEQSG
jgi:DNA-binding response OmpR family regulator